MGTTKKTNQRARTNQSINLSCKLGAQLMSVWCDRDKRLVNDKGADLGCTKGEHCASLNLFPHYVGKNKVAKAYGPAEFNEAIKLNGGADQLLEREGDKVVKTYVYRERNVNVELIEEDNDNGSKSYPIYTLEEAKKKAKGETGAKAIKVWSRVEIAEYGWGPKLIFTVLEQSQDAISFENKATKSREAYEAIEHVYIVKNIRGTETVIEVEKPELNF